MANKSVSDLKRRANERRMLEIQMEGLRKNEKNWDSYIKSLDRKALVTKGLAYADLATGLGGIAKAVVKKAAKKLGRVSMNKGSQFAKRSTRATQSQTAKKVASKAGKTRGKASTGDILGGVKTKRKAPGKPAPKQSSMPQSMSKNKNAPRKKRDDRDTPAQKGGYVDRNKASVKVGQRQGESFAKATGTKPFSREYKKAINEVLHQTNRGKSYENATKSVRLKQPKEKLKAQKAKAERTRTARKLSEEKAKVRARKKNKKGK
jgi:hypothetical protein|tara:strand:- start:57 stop:845 length:789 start_codon:yes stop_codon:yes gene_type:complete